MLSVSVPSRDGVDIFQNRGGTAPGSGAGPRFDWLASQVRVLVRVVKGEGTGGNPRVDLEVRDSNGTSLPGPGGSGPVVERVSGNRVYQVQVPNGGEIRFFNQSDKVARVEYEFL